MGEWVDGVDQELTAVVVAEPALPGCVVVSEMALGLLQELVHALPAGVVNFDLALGLQLEL